MNTSALFPSLVILVTIIFFLIGLLAQGLNLTLTDALTTGLELGLGPVGVHLIDVWGYYDDSMQTEYAILGMGGKSTQLRDITNPFDIQVVIVRRL